MMHIKVLYNSIKYNFINGRFWSRLSHEHEICNVKWAPFRLLSIQYIQLSLIIIAVLTGSLY